MLTKMKVNTNGYLLVNKHFNCASKAARIFGEKDHGRERSFSSSSRGSYSDIKHVNGLVEARRSIDCAPSWRGKALQELRGLGQLDPQDRKQIQTSRVHEEDPYSTPKVSFHKAEMTLKSRPGHNVCPKCAKSFHFARDS